MPNQYHEQNRLSWNEATRRHNQHKGDQAKFLREGGSTLFPEEVALLGNLRGKSLLHLQCNAGQDTLSIASKLGADVTGVDISDEAVDFATCLSRDSGIPGVFIRSDLFDWFDQNRRTFDVVFTSYGATGWLSDLQRWGRGIASALKPGGKFVMIEFHPAALMFEKDWILHYDYMGGTLIAGDGVGDYVAESGGALTHTNLPIQIQEKFVNPQSSYEFPWGIADHVMALLDAGLTLQLLKEYPYSNGWKPFPDMVEAEGRRMFPPKDKPIIPLMFAIIAIKPDL
ncbi:MAG: methyltransferase domain-containing protein [Chloroflexi bacterium]|nr:MAG: methyltransferase domain-containing protein [Chloroflexota bacterium]